MSFEFFIGFGLGCIFMILLKIFWRIFEIYLNNKIEEATQ